MLIVALAGRFVVALTGPCGCDMPGLKPLLAYSRCWPIAVSWWLFCLALFKPLVVFPPAKSTRTNSNVQPQAPNLYLTRSGQPQPGRSKQLQLERKTTCYRGGCDSARRKAPGTTQNAHHETIRRAHRLLTSCRIEEKTQLVLLFKLALKQRSKGKGKQS